MCLFKVYEVDEQGNTKLLAKGVVLVVKEGDRIRLVDESLAEKMTIEGYEIVKVDTLNEVLLLKKRS